MDFSRLDVALDGAIAVITLNRPEKGNAIDAPMWEEIRDAVTSYSEVENR